MIDPYLLRFNLHWVASQLARKKFFLDIEQYQKQEILYRSLQKKTEKLLSKRKMQSELFKKLKFNGENVESLKKSAFLLGEELKSVKLKYIEIKQKIKQYMLSLPNIPDDQIPNGSSNKENINVMYWGKPLQYNFKLKNHMELGKLIGGLDFNNAAKLTGSRFVVMKGKIAHLHRALAQFMIDIHTQKHGYEEYYVPYLVNEKSLYGSGQLPKFYNDLFHIKYDKTHTNTYTLIPTAEVPLINLMRNVILDSENLPIKMIAHTPCFRSEAGTYGSFSRGLIRTHQFDKVEIVQVVCSEQSMQILEEITKHAEKILQLLNLPYRKVLLCAGNTGFSACKTYDLEVWFPALNNYCEVASCSNVGDFQSRRIKARYYNKSNKKTKFLHILNASGLAIGRTLAAILENYQLQDGRIKIPSVLCSYMHGLSYLEN